MYSVIRVFGTVLQQVPPLEWLFVYAFIFTRQSLGGGGRVFGNILELMPPPPGVLRFIRLFVYSEQSLKGTTPYMVIRLFGYSFIRNRS